ncbi:Hypothetical predicted protein [Lynx pardinus]|uniref:Uncharacterized protein n=1 Tax=Lynx pardinus TaxID=191816 RepID=A0A485M8P2_LYNPA|nr:Hypothetical predicted protein [Lynx pardinus]
MGGEPLWRGLVQGWGRVWAEQKDSRRRRGGAAPAGGGSHLTPREATRDAATAVDVAPGAHREKRELAAEEWPRATGCCLLVQAATVWQPGRRLGTDPYHWCH